MHTKVDYSSILNRLNTIWALCFGLVTALAIIGFWLPHIWLPLFGLALCVPLVLYNHKYVSHSSAHCPHFTVYTMLALVYSSITIITIDFINRRLTHVQLAVDNMNHYIPSLIIYPVTAIVFATAIFRRSKNKHCRTCNQRAGYSMRETLERNVLHHETKMLLWLMFALNAIVAVAVWAYFIFFYVDYNFTKTDSLVFLIIPVTVFISSEIYVLSRISGMQFEITMSPGRASSEQYSMIRILALKDDRIFLTEIKADNHGTGMWDTPFTKSVEYTEEYSSEKAHTDFSALSGCRDFTMRPLFVSNTASHNAFHFIAILPPDSDFEPADEGSWLGIYEINSLLVAGHVTRPLALEIHRIYTVTMAWKTYDKNGKRLYPIKRYRPTFRLSDFKEWNVDYGDPIWLDVANNNEDRPFFALRKFFRKHIAGLDR